MNNKVGLFNWNACLTCKNSSSGGCKLSNNELIRGYKFTEDAVYCSYYIESQAAINQLRNPFDKPKKK